MKRSTPLARKTRLLRKTRLRLRSVKRELVMVQRRALIRDILTEHPRCQICALHPSVHVHEVLSRGRGGSILDRNNCLAVCSLCHRELHANPAWAASVGLLRHSWDGV